MTKTIHMVALLLAWSACGGGEGYDQITIDEQAVASPANLGVAPPGSSPYGLTYGEWAAGWWRWALAQPAAQNPLTDETGADCAVGQAGRVWFLAGNFGGVTHRECKIPEGRALFFPMASVYWIQTLQDPVAPVDDLRANIRSLLEGTEVTAIIDGREVVQPTRYYEESPVITVHLPADNIFGLDATNCAADGSGVACRPFLDAGYYLFVRPLERGEHTIRFTGYIPAFDFSLDVTYTLQVG